jgi:hypothetical protein
MDFSKIIINGYTYALNYRLPNYLDNALLLSHFKREAKKAAKQYFEYDEFFNGCNSIVSAWRSNIQSQLRLEQNNKNSLINLIKRNGYRDGNTGEIVTDHQRIAPNIESLETERDSYTIADFTVAINKITGATIPKDTSVIKIDKDNEYSLKYNQLDIIEIAIRQAKTELTTEQTSQPTTIAEQPEENTNEENSGKPQQYTFDIEKVTAVYNFCIETKVISNSISNVDFINAVATANFAKIYFREKTIKTKFKYIIHILSFSINDINWYKEAANSIKVTPSMCSGANVKDRADRWSSNADKLKCNKK